MSSSGRSKPFTCQACGKDFALPRATVEQFPNWTPPLCPQCYGSGGRSAGKAGGPQRLDLKPAGKSAAGEAAETREPPLELSAGPLVQPVEDPRLAEALERVLQRYDGGPKHGLFTDGGAIGNPGPGGWAAVLVRGNELVAQRYGRAPHTTNNRMELTALIAAFQMIGPDERVLIHSDSDLCVKTITLWAAGWERRGWRRRSGPIANLELVQQAYALSQERPNARLKWIKAHSGNRWNEYVDTLATGDL
jgi:ribonuclease HI